MHNFPALTADMVNADWVEWVNNPLDYDGFGHFLCDKYLEKGQYCPRLRWADTIQVKIYLIKHINRTEVIPVMKSDMDDHIPF